MNRDRDNYHKSSLVDVSGASLLKRLLLRLEMKGEAGSSLSSVHNNLSSNEAPQSFGQF